MKKTISDEQMSFILTFVIIQHERDVVVVILMAVVIMAVNNLSICCVG